MIGRGDRLAALRGQRHAPRARDRRQRRRRGRRSGLGLDAPPQLLGRDRIQPFPSRAERLVLRDALHREHRARRSRRGHSASASRIISSMRSTVSRSPRKLLHRASASAPNLRPVGRRVSTYCSNRSAPLDVAPRSIELLHRPHLYHGPRAASRRSLRWVGNSTNVGSTRTTRVDPRRAERGGSACGTARDGARRAAGAGRLAITVALDAAVRRIGARYDAGVPELQLAGRARVADDRRSGLELEVAAGAGGARHLASVTTGALAVG